MSIKLIVGLGNPGSLYEKSRHNVGWMVLDNLARFHKLRFKAGKGDFLVTARGSLNFQLMKPLTSMNRSGIAVIQAVEQYRILLEDLMVITDDLDLPLGRFRFRKKGSSGGHKGLASVIYYLGSEEFPRLRIGISSLARKETPADEFVLEEFTTKELSVICDIITMVTEAMNHYLTNGITSAMNTYNKYRHTVLNQVEEEI
jgi:PTH1 family peptidyl-tRNA hydrolase